MGTWGVPDTWQVSWAHGGPGAGTWGGPAHRGRSLGPMGSSHGGDRLKAVWILVLLSRHPCQPQAGAAFLTSLNK